MSGQLKSQLKADNSERMNRPAQTRAFPQRCDACKRMQALREPAGRFDLISGRSGSDSAPGNADSRFGSSDRLPGGPHPGHSIGTVPVMPPANAERRLALPQGQLKTLSSIGFPIQARLAINQPGDALEQEADRIAENVMKMPLSSLPQERAPLTQLHRSSAQAMSSPVPAIVGEVLRSPGAPLDAATRAFMEPRFGYDFGQVRVHYDSKAAESTRAINALAYTFGHDIVLNKTPEGIDDRSEKRLLAHELAHVVQQGPCIARQSGETDKEIIPICHKKPYEGFGEDIQKNPRIFDGKTYIYKIWGEWKEKDAIGIFKNRVFSLWIKWRFKNISDQEKKKVLDYMLAQDFEQYLQERYLTIGCFYNIPLEKKVYAQIRILSGEVSRESAERKAKEESKSTGSEGGNDAKDKGASGAGKTGERRSAAGSKEGSRATGKPPGVIIKMENCYYYLLKHFPNHEVFSKLGAKLNDFVIFAANRPALFDDLSSRMPDIKQDPVDILPFESFLGQWRAFILAMMEGAKGERKTGSDENKGSPEGEQGGIEEGITRFDASADLQIVNEQPKYVKGSKIEFLVHFDNSNERNNRMNFPPYENHAVFDWVIYRDRRYGLAPEKYNNGPVFKSGARQYELTLEKLGTYSAEVKVSSPYFKNGTLYPSRKNILVVAEMVRAREAFDELLAQPDDPRSPFERDENGKLKLKSGVEPYSIDFILAPLKEEIEKLGDLSKRGVDENNAKQYKKYLEDQINALTQIKEEESKPKFKRYVAEGIFLSRENSQSARLNSIMFRKNWSRSPKHLTYEVDLLDMTQDPSNPQHHPGNADLQQNIYVKDTKKDDLIRAEKKSIAEMASHFHKHNDYPDGKVILKVKSLEDEQLLELPPIETDNPGKTFRSVLGWVGVVAGAVALAATPFTGGASASVGIVMLQTSAAAIGLSTGLFQWLWDMNERYERERTIKTDRRLLMDIISLVTIAMSAGGFSSLVGSAKHAGKLLYISSIAGLDIGSGVVLTDITGREISRIEALYAVKIAKNPENKIELEKEKKDAVARVIGTAALNGFFVVTSLAVGTHQIVSAVGSKSGRSYSVRQEIRDLATSANVEPKAIHERLNDPNVRLLQDERSFLQESLAAPKDKIPITKGEVKEQKIGKLGKMTEETQEMLRSPDKEDILGALVKNERAAKALKHCSKLCFPDNMTREQIEAVEDLLKRAENLGGYKPEEVRDFLYENRSRLDKAISYLKERVDTFEAYLKERADTHEVMQAEQKRGTNKREPGLRRDDPRWSEKATGGKGSIGESATFGRMSEIYLKKLLQSQYVTVGEQVRIRPNRADGKPAEFYFIADFLVCDSAGQFTAIDSKLTTQAPLTALQRIGYPMVASNGGTVESRNGPISFSTKIPIGSRVQRATPKIDLKDAAPGQSGVEFNFSDIASPAPKVSSPSDVAASKTQAEITNSNPEKSSQEAKIDNVDTSGKESKPAGETSVVAPKTSDPKAATKSRLLDRIEEIKSLKLQIYSEIQKASLPGKSRISPQERAALVNEARNANEIELRLQKELSELEITPYQKARAYSYSETAAKEVIRRSRGHDELSGKKLDDPTIDHIISVDRMVNLEGWNDLSWEDHKFLLSRTYNLLMMERSINSSKGNKRFSNWEEGRRIYGDEIWNKMVAKENEVERLIQTEINARRKTKK